MSIGIELKKSTNGGSKREKDIRKARRESIVVEYVPNAVDAVPCCLKLFIRKPAVTGCISFQKCLQTTNSKTIFE